MEGLFLLHTFCHPLVCVTTAELRQLFAWKNHLEFLSWLHSKNRFEIVTLKLYRDEECTSTPAQLLIVGDNKLILSYSK